MHKRLVMIGLAINDGSRANISKGIYKKIPPQLQEGDIFYKWSFQNKDPLRFEEKVNILMKCLSKERPV